MLWLLVALPFLQAYSPDGRYHDVQEPGGVSNTPGPVLPANCVDGTLPGNVGIDPPEKEKIQWMTLSQAQAKQAQAPRPILIDLYTDWCGWCKVMDKKTYAQSDVAKYINEHYYPVKLDAEGKESLTWRGRSFGYNASARIHNFAIFLTNGQLSFPQTIFIMPGDQQPQAIPGYLEVKDMELLLKYFGEGHYGKTPFPDYQKKFSHSW
jgi:thioredoxin-related protein